MIDYREFRRELIIALASNPALMKEAEEDYSQVAVTGKSVTKYTAERATAINIIKYTEAITDEIVRTKTLSF